MFEFTVKPDGGETFTAEAGTRDVLVWERSTKGKTLQQLDGNLAIVDLYKIAHIASRRLGLFHGSLEEFEQTCEIEVDQQEEETDPTQPDH